MITSATFPEIGSGSFLRAVLAYAGIALFYFGMVSRPNKGFKPLVVSVGYRDVFRTGSG